MGLTLGLSSAAGNLSAQATFSKLNVGLDAGPLMSGTPQLLIDYHPHPVIGLTAATGYMFRPMRGGLKVDDDVELLKSRGAYFKLGLRLQTKTKDLKKDPAAFIHLPYIRSAYNERAERSFYNSTTEEFERGIVTPRGVVNGLAATVGIDFPIRRRLILRSAMQLGHYKRNDHAGKDFLTVQPGFGSVFFLPDMPQQLMLGLVYRMGEKTWKALDKKE